MLLLVVLAVLFFAECQGQSYDPVACGVSRPHNLWVNETTPDTINSPYYELDYTSDARCDWNIHAQDPGQLIELKFFDFNVEYCTECKCDAVEVYDADVPDPAKLIGTYCGISGQDAIPDSIKSTGSDMYVRFRSDSNYQFKGFLARYGYPLATTACTAEGQEETRPYGVIFTPNWPLNYGDNLVCRWHFIAPEGQRVRFNTTEFATENCCNCDYLQIYDGMTTNAPRFGRWSGTNTLPPVITSTGNHALITFNADASVNLKGFLIQFEHI